MDESSSAAVAVAKSTIPDSNRLQGNRSGPAAASTIGTGDSPPSSSTSTSKLGQEDAASAGGKSSHILTPRSHRSKRDVSALFPASAAGPNPPNPVNVSSSSSGRSSVVRVVLDAVMRDVAATTEEPLESMHAFQESTPTYRNPINGGGTSRSSRSSINTGDGINPVALDNTPEPEEEELPQQPETLLLSSSSSLSSDPDAPLNGDLIDLFSHEGFIPVSASVVHRHRAQRPTRQSSRTLQFDKSSPEPSSQPPPSEQYSPTSQEATPIGASSSNHVTADSLVPDYVDDDVDSVSGSTLPNDVLRGSPANINPNNNLLFTNGDEDEHQELVPLLSRFVTRTDPPNLSSLIITGHLEGLTTTADDDVDYYFDDTIDNGLPGESRDPLLVTERDFAQSRAGDEKESLLLQQTPKQKKNTKKGDARPRQQRHNQRQPQLASDVVNAKTVVSSTAASAEGGRRKKSANPDGAMKNEPVKLTVPLADASGDGVYEDRVIVWSEEDDDLLRRSDDDALMRYNYDNHRIEEDVLDKGHHDMDIRPLVLQEMDEESNYIDNPFSYNVVGQDASLDENDDYANANNDDALPGDVSVTNNKHSPAGSSTNTSDDLLLHGSPKAPPTIDHDKSNNHNANDKSTPDNAQSDSNSRTQRILVNVSIATDSGSGTQNHAIYMLHVSLPAGPDLRTFDNYNQSLNPHPIPIHVPLNPNPPPHTTSVPLSPVCPPCSCGANDTGKGPTNARTAWELNSTIIEHANGSSEVEQEQEGTTITNELMTSLETEQESSTTTEEEGDQTDRSTVATDVTDYTNFPSSTIDPVTSSSSSCSSQCPDIPILILEGERVSENHPCPSVT